MANGNIKQVNVPTPVVGIAGDSLGLFIATQQQSLQIFQIRYSFRDVNQVFNPGVNVFQSRLAIVRGYYNGDALAFAITTDLSQYQVLEDLDLNDVGPASVLYSPDAYFGRIYAPPDALGISVLLAIPFASVGGTSFQAKLAVGVGAAPDLFDVTGRRISAGGGNGALPVAPGGGTGGGKFSGGGGFGSGGGGKPRL